MFSKEKPKPDFEMFNLFDTKVGIYNDPMLAVNRFDMVRQLEQMMQDPAQEKNKFVQNAEDFQLFKIASYSRRDGRVEGHNPEHVVNLHDIKSSVRRLTDVQNTKMGIDPT